MQLDNSFEQQPQFHTSFSPEDLQLSPEHSIPSDFHMEIDPEEMVRIDEINEILQSEEVEPNIALNILINAVQICYDNEVFNELDKYLIAKAFDCFQKHVDRNEDMVIKVNQ